MSGLFSGRILPGDNLSFDLEDGRFLNVNISHEGIIMDVYNYIDGWEDSRDMGLEGTVAMMFDEWADWIGADTV